VHPGWVGLGWNLSAGGSITRVVNDEADESYSGYYNNHNYFARSDWASTSRMHETAQNEVTEMFLTGYGVFQDQMPDEFNFSFLGITGAFYLDENGNWKVRCDQEKVQVIYGDFGKFILVDPKGIKYVFGGDVNSNSLEYTHPLFPTFYTLIGMYNTWNLTEVIMPDGNKITFNYERGETIISPQISYFSDNGAFNKLLFTGSSINTSYLKSIQTDKEVVTFSRSPTTELQFSISAFSYTAYRWGSSYDVDNSSTKLPIYNKLDKIEVADKNSGIIKSTFTFSYSNDLNKRLKLQKVSETGEGGSANGSDFSISYNDVISLPNSYFAQQTDFWGFYNGTATDYSSEPNFNASKLTNPTYLQAELINKITYPTGGCTKFTFEANTYSKETAPIRYDPLVSHTADQVGSGSRIQKIENFDRGGQLLNSKRYVYQSNYSSIGGSSGLSSGVLGAKSSTEWGNSLIYFGEPCPGSYDNNGSAITYGTVYEISSDGGYVKSVFSNFDTGVSGEYMDLPPINSVGDAMGGLGFISKFFERGNILNKSIYDNNDHLLNQDIFQYTRFNSNTEYVRGYKLKYGYNITTYAVADESNKATEILTYPYLLNQKASYTYPNPTSTALYSTTAYTYDPATQNLINMSNTDNTGTSWVTKYRYASDILSGATISANPNQMTSPYSYMYSQHMIGIPIETIQSVVKNGTETIIGANLTKQQGTLGFSGTYGTPNFSVFNNVKPLSDWRLQTAIPKTTYTNYSVYIDIYGEHEATIDPQLVPSVNYQWDDRGTNLLQLATDGGAPVSYIWAYNNLFPIAEIKNASSNEVYYQGFEGTYVGAYQMTTGGHIDPHYVSDYQVTGSYNISANYIVNWTPPNGRSYLITYWVKSNGIWTRQPPLPYTPGFNLRMNATTVSTANGFDDVMVYPADAQISTYSYDPFAGMTSSTDHMGLTTYYEYDSFRRLVNSKNMYGEILKHIDYHFGQ